MQGFNSLLPSSTTWQSFLTSVKRIELSLFESAGKLKKGAKDYEEQNFEMTKWCKSNNNFIFCTGVALARVRGVWPNPSISRGGFSNLSIFGHLEQKLQNFGVYMK